MKWTIFFLSCVLMMFIFAVGFTLHIAWLWQSAPIAALAFSTWLRWIKPWADERRAKHALTTKTQ